MADQAPLLEETCRREEIEKIYFILENGDGRVAGTQKDKNITGSCFMRQVYNLSQGMQIDAA